MCNCEEMNVCSASSSQSKDENDLPASNEAKKIFTGDIYTFLKAHNNRLYP